MRKLLTKEHLCYQRLSRFMGHWLYILLISYKTSSGISFLTLATQCTYREMIVIIETNQFHCPIDLALLNALFSPLSCLVYIVWCLRNLLRTWALMKDPNQWRCGSSPFLKIVSVCGTLILSGFVVSFLGYKLWLFISNSKILKAHLSFRIFCQERKFKIISIFNSAHIHYYLEKND